jgi:hypothetical protein
VQESVALVVPVTARVAVTLRDVVVAVADPIRGVTWSCHG